MQNLIVMDGIIGLDPVLTTSVSGIQQRTWVFQHQSEREDFGIRRNVWFRITVIVSGPELVTKSESFTVGQKVRVEGFISASKTKKGAVGLFLYATDVEVIPEEVN